MVDGVFGIIGPVDKRGHLGKGNLETTPSGQHQDFLQS